MSYFTRLISLTGPFWSHQSLGRKVGFLFPFILTFKDILITKPPKSTSAQGEIKVKSHEEKVHTWSGNNNDFKI